jgi:hypothetical protein
MHVDDEHPPISISAERERSGEELLAIPAPQGPEPDWEEQKRETLDAPSARPDSGFVSLAGCWQGRVKIGDDFDELPDELAESLGMKP